MLAVNLGEEAVTSYLAKVPLTQDVAIACVNSPTNVTLSADGADIELLKSHFDRDKIFSAKIRTGVAYHSPAMHAIAEDYLSACRSITPEKSSPDAALMVSSVTGHPISPSAVGRAEYWVENLVSKVRFADALEYLVHIAPKEDHRFIISDMIEIGPHSALRRPLLDTLSHMNSKSIRYMSALSRFQSPMKSITEVAGHLWARGYTVSINKVNQEDAGVPKSLLPEMPAYPFDTTQSYWHESRFSKGWRLRDAAPNEVLGVRSLDWNPLQPQWRKFVSSKEPAWVADHVVSGTAVFPGTGMLVMAVEAARHAASPDAVVSGFTVNEAFFSHPIVIKTESEGRVEVITQMRPMQTSYEKASNRYEVRIFAVTEQNWNECFSGIVHIEYEASTPEGFGKLFNTNGDAHALQRLHQATKDCDKYVSKDSFYQWHSQHGIKYGSAFRLTEDIHWDGRNTAVSRVQVESHHDTAALAHPAVMDALCQTCFVPPSKGATTSLPTVVPHKIGEVWLAASGWQHRETSKIRMVGTTKIKTGILGLDCDLTAFGENDKVLSIFKKLEMLPVLTEQTAQETERKLLHSFEWIPDISLLTPEQILEYCMVRKPTACNEREMQYLGSQNDSLLRTMNDCVGLLKHTQWASLAEWLEGKLESMETELPTVTKLPEKVGLCATRREVDLGACCISQGTAPSPDGGVPGLPAAVPDACGRPNVMFMPRLSTELAKYFELLTHHSSLLRVLEVGAGEGHLTKHILSMLEERESKTGGIAFKEYLVTDSSTHVVEQLAKTLGGGTRMTFQQLDINRDVTSQGIDLKPFDLIVAGPALSVCDSVSNTLRGLSQFLKSHGKLILYQPTRPDLFIEMRMGLLAGKIRGQGSFDPRFQILSNERWKEALHANGFSGSYLTMKADEESDAHTFSTIVVDKDSQPIDCSGLIPPRLVITTGGSTKEQELADVIAAELSRNSPCDVHVTTIREAKNESVSSNDYMIFLADTDAEFLSGLREETFGWLKKAMQRWHNVLWVASDVQRHDLPPFSGLQDGFLRTLRSEFSNKRIVSVKNRHQDWQAVTLGSQIARVFRAAFAPDAAELEYAIDDGYILTPRVVEEVSLSKKLSASLKAELSMSPWLPGPPLKLDVGTRGSLETLQFVEDDDYYAPIQPDAVEIEARSWGLSFRDVFIALGKLEEDDFGIDCAGIVTRCGANTRFSPGDRVCMAALGCMKTYPRTNQWAVKIPDSLSFEEAAAVVNPGLTAYYSLIEVARLRKGEKILIHAASGGTGQLAILAAQMVGAEVFCTVGFEQKKQLLMELYSIPEDHIFYSRDTRFKEGVLKATNGMGVDVILNSLVGEGLRASWECVAPYGRFVELGKMDIKTNSPLPMSCFANNVSFFAVDVRHISLTRPALGEGVLETLLQLTANKTLSWPKPLHVYALPRLEDAFRYLQSGKSAGRILINVDRNAVVPVSLMSSFV
jgi:NADPH:quinone reductase-like Zn-dependent oxidoreductase/phospholipid N-methyltransferase